MRGPRSQHDPVYPTDYSDESIVPGITYRQWLAGHVGAQIAWNMICEQAEHDYGVPETMENIGAMTWRVVDAILAAEYK